MTHREVVWIVLAAIVIFGVKIRMSLIEDFNSLPFAVKAIIASLLVLSPYGFIIYYHYMPAFLSIGWYEKLFFIAALITAWYGIELVICAIALPRVLAAFSLTDFDNRFFWLIAFIEAFVYLMFFFLLAYYNHWSFEKFLWYALGLRVLMLIYCIILAVFT